MSAAEDGSDEGPLRGCRLIIRQGPPGLPQLRQFVKAAGGAPWVLRVPLVDAVKADNLPCLRYLVDDVKVETLNARSDGYTALQQAVIWGKLQVMVYLLSRGAEPMLGTEASVVDMARLRQQRLNEALEQSGEGAEFEGFTITRSRIEPLIDEGLAMLEVLEGIEARGSYPAWAELNGGHPLVKRFSGGKGSPEPRYQLTMLRSLVLARRAELRSAAERAAMAAEKAAQEAAKAKEEQPVMDALIEAGFNAETAKEIRNSFNKPTVKALRAAKISPEDIEARLEAPVRQKRMTEGERRRFERFIRELDQPPPAPAPAAAGKAAAGKGGGYGEAKSKAKAKAAPNPAAKAALLAMASKGAGRGTAAKAPKAAKSGPVDGFDLLVRDGLPDSAFMLTTRFLFGI